MAVRPSLGIATVIENSSASSAVTPAKFIQWDGVASMMAGVLTVVANLLHQPRSFATLVHDAQHTTWEVVHVLAIAAFVMTAFALIALYACRSSGLA
jgi:hypothetical protein